MKNNKLVDEMHSKYSEKIGSNQIATKLALEIISNHLEDSNCEVVLEIGSGIGTISELVTRVSPESSLYCFEVNDWCIEQLKGNLIGARYNLLKSVSELTSLNVKVDFLIVDDWIDKKTTQIVISQTRPRAVFIEGHRRKQRLYVIQAFKKLRLPFRFKNFRASKDSYKGGCLVSVIDAPRVFEFRYFLFIYATLVYSKTTELRSRVHLRAIVQRIWKK